MDTRIANQGTEQEAGRIKRLEDVIRALLRDVDPHVRATGHNAADRKINEAIKAARAEVPD